VFSHFFNDRKTFGIVLRWRDCVLDVGDRLSSSFELFSSLIFLVTKVSFSLLVPSDPIVLNSAFFGFKTPFRNDAFLGSFLRDALESTGSSDSDSHILAEFASYVELRWVVREKLCVLIDSGFCRNSQTPTDHEPI
jgi:hypothetical protein